MLIRQATIEDYVGVCAIFAEVDAQHVEAQPQVFRDPGGAARPRDYIASILEDENACLWVAEHEGRIVGIVKIALRETRDIPVLVPRRYAEIGTLAVAREYRRRGIGRALMEVSERWARERGADQIELGVWEFNEHARAFYNALGYRTARRRMWKRSSDQTES
jgi:ribosomal protein S18 acetylase RimI-like enzyme